MKNLILGLALLLMPLQVFAGVELFQLVIFNWDEAEKKLQLVSLGSGTAIGKNLIITNKHVVKVKDKPADFILLCQSKSKSTRKVECNTAAGVSALHRDFDVALVRPIASSVFLPSVKTSTAHKRKDDVVRIVGFPVPDGMSQNFGGQATLQAFKEWEASPSSILKIKGDKPTTTRGKVLARYLLENTGETYVLTNAKVNFGNSGGAAFDQFGDFIGIPSLKDKAGNSFILEYAQIKDWVLENSNKRPQFAPGALEFYNSITHKRSKSNTRWAQRNKKLKRGSAYKKENKRKSFRSLLRARLAAKRKQRSLQQSMGLIKNSHNYRYRSFGRTQVKP